MAVATQKMSTTDFAASRRLLTVDEYHTMAVAGILHEDDRIELIEGDIIEMAPVGDLHINVLDALTEIFVLAAAGKARVSVQNPVRLNPRSEPQPDLLLLRRESIGQGAGRPEDVLLLVEIADTSLVYEDGAKRGLYAQAGIERYLIVDLQGKAVLVYTEPRADNYRQTTRYTSGDTITINTDDILS